MKRLFIIFFVSLLLLAVPLTVYLTMKNQELRKKAAPATTLKLTPQTVQKKVGEEFTLAVTIDTADNDVVAAEITVLYDPTKVEALSITNGSLFPNVLSSGTISNGMASISIGAANSATPVNGEGVALSIKFKAIGATTTPLAIRFDSNTFIGALGESSGNVLTSAIPATVTIADSAAMQPTPTPTISLAITPLPTQNAQLSPTPTSTPTPTSSPSAFTITTPLDNEAIQTNQPTFQGIAPAGATITITVYSDPITATVIADANGNWTYTLSEPISDGPHSIVASFLHTTTGQTNSATRAFVVASGNINEDDTETSVIPESGFEQPLQILLLLGSFFILTGLLVPRSVRR